MNYESKLLSTCCFAPVRTKLRGEPKQVVHICTKCCYKRPAREFLTRATLQPAYGRRPITETRVLNMLYRGLDYQIFPSGRYTSIRDMAPGCLLTIYYGKKLHKTLDHEFDPSDIIKSS